MKYKELIDAIINEQAADAKELVNETLSEMIDVQIGEYEKTIKESLFGLEKTSVEVNEENIDEILESLSEEDAAALAEELEALEAEGLSEEELAEISKERVASYVVKSVADREKQSQSWNNAQKNKIKSGDNLRNAKRNGPDKDYGESDANHADRVKRLEKRYDSDKKSVADADRKQTNRNKGLYRAGKNLAKD